MSFSQVFDVRLQYDSTRTLTMTTGMHVEQSW